MKEYRYSEWDGELMLLFEQIKISIVEFLTGVAEAVPGLHASTVDGPYVYTRDIGLNLTTQVIGGRVESAWHPTQIERWRRSDGSGRILRRNYPPGFVSAGAPRPWEAGAEHDVQIVDRRVHAGEFSTLQDVWEGVMPLSDDPEILSRQLISVTDGSAQRQLMAVKDIYYDLGIVGASLRTAILRVLAGVDGLILMGRTSDGSGRAVFGISAPVDSQGAQFTLLPDLVTGELNGHQEVLVKRSGRLDLESPGLLSYGERQTWGRTRDTGSRP
ncbi:hypothetical protein OHT57_01425 [Streptomyces sp. NBC_00285]|uniref:hypothetical protein n=1 Tax=Streptomyces sp. NBC_00285 TaxID=2975700 RepID=UPI002E2AFBD0|nr:hypothetical protein [Streptomyces sp. NBC_00285]